MENILYKFQELENENSLEEKIEFKAESEIDLLINFFSKFQEMEDLSPMLDIVVINNIFNKLFLIFSHAINILEKISEPYLFVKI